MTWGGRVLDSSTGLYQGFLAKPAPTIYYVFVAMTYLLRSGLCQDGTSCRIFQDIHYHIAQNLQLWYSLQIFQASLVW